jgi:hypothetical protein
MRVSCGGPARTANHDRRELCAEDILGIDAERAAERSVHVRQSAVHVCAADDVALTIEKITIARIAVAQLPLEILEALEARMRLTDETRFGKPPAFPVAEGARCDAFRDARSLQQACEAAKDDRAVVNAQR